MSRKCVAGPVQISSRIVMGGVDWDGVNRGLHAAGYADPFTYGNHNAFCVLMDLLVDDTLRYAVTIARYSISQISGESGVIALGKAAA